MASPSSIYGWTVFRILLFSNSGRNGQRLISHFYEKLNLCWGLSKKNKNVQATKSAIDKVSYMFVLTLYTGLERLTQMLHYASQRWLHRHISFVDSTNLFKPVIYTRQTLFHQGVQCFFL